MLETADMPVIATAGHVDHGKSTLVRALTGQDPDRLEEEHRRGLSIELGYCWTDLEGMRDVAFVDVPGHEGFLSTTISGLGPVPAVMLVVAADDPWMPQAAEHLAVIDALGIRHGVLVVTRSDLADPGPALRRARAEVDLTSLAGCPGLAVSGRTGAGLSALRSTLAEMLRSMATPSGADVRFWVDRVFTLPGAGTVATGTLPAGVIRAGDDLAHGSERLRVRGMESLGEAVSEVIGPARVALRLGRQSTRDVGRGSVLVTPDAYADVTEMDVLLHGAGQPPARPLLHLGSARVSVHARPVGERHARLRLDRPLPLRHGDRVVLRDPGSRALWGAHVLDADPPPLNRRGAARERAAALEAWRADLAGEVERRGAVRRELLTRLSVSGDPPVDALEIGGWVVSARRAAELRAALTDVVRHSPDGISPAAAAAAAHVPDVELVHALVADPVVRRGGRLVLDQTLPQHLRNALDQLARDLVERPFQAPDTERLTQLGLDRSGLSRLGREGHLLVLGEGVVLLPGADSAACDVLGALPAPFTTSQARQALGTSRRVVLPLLAHLDRTGSTVRLPDDTRRVRAPYEGGTSGPAPAP
jgi:selenocysteine-specific elongation factor